MPERAEEALRGLLRGGISMVIAMTIVNVVAWPFGYGFGWFHR